MTLIITGAQGSIAYCAARAEDPANAAFDVKGTFRRPCATGFARLSRFPMNGNHAPSSLSQTAYWDRGRDLLFRITGAEPRGQVIPLH